MSRTHNRSRGYSLVEVLIAMALLGVVVMSIMGMFTFARRNVYSGKQMTQAVSVAQGVLEDLQQMKKSHVLDAFEVPAGAGASVAFNGTTYTNSILRTTASISSTTNDATYDFLNKWNNLIVNNNKFKNGRVTLILTPEADATNSPAQFATATVLRMRVFVTWSEATRNRQIVLDSVKVER